MTLHPDKLPLIQALADGELDIANTLAIEDHLKNCGDCRAEYARIEDLRGLLAPMRKADRPPAALRSRIEALIDSESTSGRVGAAPSTRPYRGWVSGAVMGALAASLVLTIGLPQLTQPGTEDQLIQSHIRALQVDHAVDIPTSDRHVVKPWFNGKIDFAPPVPELKSQGFPLVGGRLDYADGHAVAAIVYHRRLHTINLFVRPAGASAPYADRRQGYGIRRWSDGGLEYWAISDIDSGDLALFERAYRKGG